MSSNQPQQLEIPAPDAPAPTCVGCGRTTFGDDRVVHEIEANPWLCNDCAGNVADYWTRDRALPEQPVDADIAHEGDAGALRPLAQAVRRYAALRAATETTMKGVRHE